ncbi:MAG: type II toxin-antitoxin system Phd/YefM family antitoxin [bacterium]
MTRVEIAEATASLAEYTCKMRKEPVVVTRRGRPVAALMPLSKEDWEDLVVGNHPAFMKLLKRSRSRYKPGNGVPLGEIRRKYGTKPRARRKAAAAAKRR